MCIRDRVSKEDGEKLFASFVTNHVAKKTNDDLIMAFSAASSVFPVLPAVASRLFLTEGFVQGLVPHLERNSEAAASGKKYVTVPFIIHHWTA